MKLGVKARGYLQRGGDDHYISSLMREKMGCLTKKKKTKINILYEGTKNKGINSRLAFWGVWVGYGGKEKDGNVN